MTSGRELLLQLRLRTDWLNESRAARPRVRSRAHARDSARATSHASVDEGCDGVIVRNTEVTDVTEDFPRTTFLIFSGGLNRRSAAEFQTGHHYEIFSRGQQPPWLHALAINAADPDCSVDLRMLVHSIYWGSKHFFALWLRQNGHRQCNGTHFNC
jgi:hypothetical protein